MKITIPTTNNIGLESCVSDHFGRSPFLTTLDTSTEEIHSQVNRGHHFGGTVRPAAAAADAAPDVIICPNLGQKAVMFFHERGIEVFVGATGTVREVLQAYQDGKLQRATAASSCRGRADCAG
jgi:predicted Fe-Mo cluster-binding NifX family protein